jgi:hypothetical protein
MDNFARFMATRSRPSTAKSRYSHLHISPQSSFASVTGISLFEKSHSDNQGKQIHDKRLQLLEKRLQNSYLEGRKSRPSSSRSMRRTESPAPSPVPTSPGQVIIRVFDEARNVKRDFHCDRKLLVQEMKYFQSVLEHDNATKEIDVHSDIQVFERLMGFCIHNEIHLEPSNIVSILISSHFLQMEQLVEMSLVFMKERMNEVLQVPIDFGCIQSNLLARYSDFT